MQVFEGKRFRNGNGNIRGSSSSSSNDKNRRSKGIILLLVLILWVAVLNVSMFFQFEGADGKGVLVDLRGDHVWKPSSAHVTNYRIGHSNNNNDIEIGYGGGSGSSSSGMYRMNVEKENPNLRTTTVAAALLVFSPPLADARRRRDEIREEWTSLPVFFVVLEESVDEEEMDDTEDLILLTDSTFSVRSILKSVVERSPSTRLVVKADDVFSCLPNVATLRNIVSVVDDGVVYRGHPGDPRYGNRGVCRDGASVDFPYAGGAFVVSSETIRRVTRVGDVPATWRTFDVSFARLVRKARISLKPDLDGFSFFEGRGTICRYRSQRHFRRTSPSPPPVVLDLITTLASLDVPYFIPLFRSSAPTLLVGVLSGPSNRERRDRIRETWMRYYANETRAVARFFVGRHNVCGDTGQDALVAEAAAHGDMILLPDHAETYHGIAAKVEALFRVVAVATSTSDRLFRYVLKTDDDAFVRVTPVIERLEDAPDTLLFMGIPMHGQPVVRNEKNKRYYVSPAEFKPDKFSPYVSGGGVFLSRDLALHATQRARARNKRGTGPFRFEDVNTGMLLQDLIESDALEITREGRVLGWGTHGGADILRRDFLLYHYVRAPWDMQTLQRFVEEVDRARENGEDDEIIDTFGMRSYERVDIKGHDMPGKTIRGSEKARMSCLVNDRCAGVVCVRSTCYLKTSTEEAHQRENGDAVLYAKESGWEEDRSPYASIRGADVHLSNLKMVPAATVEMGKRACDVEGDACKAFTWLKGKAYLKSDYEEIRYIPGRDLYVKKAFGERKRKGGDGLAAADVGHAQPPPSFASLDSTDVRGHDLGKGSFDACAASPICAGVACVTAVNECFMKSSVDEGLRFEKVGVRLYARKGWTPPPPPAEPTTAMLERRRTELWSREGCSSVGGGGVLFTITAGRQHRELVHSVVERFVGALGDDVTFVVFHWDDDDGSSGWHPAITQHVHERGEVKLGFARTHLTPAYVCDYEYVFVWDGDVEIPSTFDARRFVEILRHDGAAVAMPGLGKESFASYHFTRARPPPQRDTRRERSAISSRSPLHATFESAPKRYLLL
eukprot:g359.t1